MLEYYPGQGESVLRYGFEQAAAELTESGVTLEEDPCARLA